MFALFGDDTDARELAQRARALGFLGAAPTDGVMRAIAPYVFAQRFAAGKSVEITDPEGAAGAAILARSASRVSANLLDRERQETARRWFDLDIYTDGGSGDRADISIGRRGLDVGRADIAIVLDDDTSPGEASIAIAAPIPPAVMVSFDPGDGAPMRQLAVAAPSARARAAAIPAMAVVPGSAGRIGIVVRSDYIGNDDADSDAALALAARLAEQGFTPTVVPANHLRPGDFDLLHIFGTRAASEVNVALERAASYPPVVITPYADDALRESMWGPSIVSSTLANAPDETLRRVYFDAIRERRLESAGLPKRGEGGVDAKSALTRAAAVVASSPEEERRLRDDLGRDGIAVRGRRPSEPSRTPPTLRR